MQPPTPGLSDEQASWGVLAAEIAAGAVNWGRSLSMKIGDPNAQHQSLGWAAADVLVSHDPRVEKIA